MHSRTDRITEPGPFNITLGTSIVFFLNPLGVRHREPPFVFGRTPRSLLEGGTERNSTRNLSRAAALPPPALCVKVACGIKTKRQRPQSSSACYEHPSEMSTLAHALHLCAVSFFPEGLKPRNYCLTYRTDVCQRNVRFLNTADLMINGQSAENGDFPARRPRSRSNSQTKPPTTILSVIALTHHFRPAEMQDGIATGYDSLREPSVKEVNLAFLPFVSNDFEPREGTLTFSRAKALVPLG